MAKLLLMSVIMATVFIPAIAVRRGLGLKQCITLMLIFNFVYMLAFINIWPTLLWTE